MKRIAILHCTVFNVHDIEEEKRRVEERKREKGRCEESRED